MINDKQLKALEILVKRLSNKNINWAIIGSTNLALQGVNVSAKDIDILTDKNGAIEIGELLKEFTIKAVNYKETEKFKSYHGLFKINDIEVEIMGDMQSKIPAEDLWTEKSRLSAKKLIKFKGLSIPVISLEQEYQAYSKIGRGEKAKQIKEFLDQNKA